MKLLIFLLLFGIISSVPFASGGLHGAGTMKVRIGRFSNIHGKLANGSCCSLYRTAPTCRGTCHTFFRICVAYSAGPMILRKTPKFPINLSSLLASSSNPSNSGKKSVMKKHPFYRQSKQNYSIESVEPPTTIDPDRSNDIDDSPPIDFGSSKELRSLNGIEVESNEPFLPCTFGVVVTDVVAGSSLEAEKDGLLEVDFPFKGPWPLTFRLVIESWNEVADPNNNSSGNVAHMEGNKTGVLISRHESRHTLQGNDDWKPFRYVVGDGMAIHYSLRVPCKTPFYGNKCSMRCDNLRSSQNNRINCTDSGEVSCLEGWTGDLCNKAICREDCHSIHGYCTQPGECKCALGWRGKNCDECVPLPGCKHGSCSNTSYECICEPGWEGNYCAIPVCRDGCHSARGYCKFPGECRCRIGWGGEICDSCKSLPGCLNGFCTKPLECRCRPGWTGLLCDEPICKANCSSEHGSCTNPGECRCDLGWWGKNCDTCFPYPGCKHGTCENPWECNCKAGWTGMTCNERKEIGGTYCDNNSKTCLNGGTCINVPDGRNYTCSCPPLFTGKQCDYLANGRASFFPIINRGSLAVRSTFSTITPLSPNLDVITTERTLTTPIISSSPLPNIINELPETTMSVSISSSVSVSTSSEISSSTESSINSSEDTEDNETHERKEPKSSKMTLKVTKIGPVNKEAVRTQEEFTTTTEDATEENSTEMLKLPTESPISLILNQSDIDLKGVAPKLNESQEENSTQEPLHEESTTPPNKESNQSDYLKIFPTAEDLYSEILKTIGSKLTENVTSGPTIQSPVIILQLQETSKGLEHPYVGKDPDSSNSKGNTITGKSRFSRHQDSVGLPTDGNAAMLVTQEVPRPSNFGSSQFIVSTNFDSLSQGSSFYPFEDYADLQPQTRINRRTGKLTRFISLSPARRISQQQQSKLTTVEEPKAKEKEKEEPKSYYEEHYDGRVHIGDVTEVDRHSPLEEIVDAFIELKKLTS